jgi:hypothetical protein
MYTWTNEDIEKVEKYIELKNKGYYCDGTQLTNDYNRILEKHVNPTNCGSCIRQRITELEGALNHWKEKEAKRKEEENKAKMAAVRAAKTKKKEE